MVTTFSLTTNILPDREVRFKVPDGVPLGPAEIVIVVAPSAAATVRTLGDLARSEFSGMWRERTDIGDSIDFAHRLRAEAWSRAA